MIQSYVGITVATEKGKINAIIFFFPDAQQTEYLSGLLPLHYHTLNSTPHSGVWTDHIFMHEDGLPYESNCANRCFNIYPNCTMVVWGRDSGRCHFGNISTPQTQGASLLGTAWNFHVDKGTYFEKAHLVYNSDLTFRALPICWQRINLLTLFILPNSKLPPYL